MDKAFPQSDSFVKYAAIFLYILFVGNPLQLLLQTVDLGLSV